MFKSPFDRLNSSDVQFSPQAGLLYVPEFGVRLQTPSDQPILQELNRWLFPTGFGQYRCSALRRGRREKVQSRIAVLVAVQCLVVQQR